MSVQFSSVQLRRSVRALKDVRALIGITRWLLSHLEKLNRSFVSFWLFLLQ